ncbi:MAG: DNA polymerase III subunit beta [Clostridiales bacterium]|nr:DNA polymerase III subunit beta [Clostridiales bacterium]
MLVNCQGLELSDALLKVSKAISNKITNPILEGIKISAEDDTLTLSATDTELSIEKKIKATVKSEGETVVPGRFITEFVKKLTNSIIELDVNEKNQMSIRYEDSQSVIQCYNPIEYPGFKKVDTLEYFGITKKDFKACVSKSIFSVAIDDSRPILKGVLFDISNNFVNVVALDGYRLARVKKNITTNMKKSIVVPARSLSELSKLIDDTDEVINIYVDKYTIMVDLGDTKVTSRLLEGDYINYGQIIPVNYESFVIVNKAQFEESLERATLLSRTSNNNFVKFDIKENNICITSNSELGNLKENIPVTLSGKDLLISFNPRYFLESLKAVGDDFVKICFNDSTKPCVIVPTEDDEYLYLILPVRIIG